jgi:hypothetical protein
LVENIGQEKISVFYAVNPTKENHQTFKVFMGLECGLNSKLVSNDFVIQQIELNNVIKGTQNSTASSQRVHKQLINYCQENKIEAKQDSIFEQFSQKFFLVEMQEKK